MAPDSNTPIFTPISIPLPASNDTSSIPPETHQSLAQNGPNSVGPAILYGYATQIDPLQTNGETHSTHEHDRFHRHSIANHVVASHSEDINPEGPRDTHATGLAPLRLSKSNPTHRKFARSTEIPQQTIMKALASKGAVDMQKLLEDISDDDFSHSRLMQTTTMIRESAKHLQRRPIKKAVRTVMIVTKAKDNKLIHLTRELAEWLLSTPRYGSDLGVRVYVDAKLRHAKRFDAAGLVRKEPRFEKMLNFWTPDLCWTNPDTFDLVLTLGGDGTVLFTSWLFQRTVPPILSFSMGSLGFLTNFAFDEYRPVLDRVMGDAGMRINLRMRFTCTVYRTDRPQPPSSTNDPPSVIEGEQFEVLNELVIDRGPSPYVSNLELWGDDSLLTRVQADGCILSTPTGSTAYSLSAGGALVHPDIPAILLTPICPHTLSFRPMLLSDTVSLRIAVPAKSRASVYCSFDGKGRVELNRGDHVTLEASQYPFPTVMTSPNEWLESVQRSLNWNTRSAEQRAWEEGLDDEGGPGAGGQTEVWDIDTDTAAYEGLDSGLGQSEDGDQENSNAATASPMRRQMSLLNM